MPNLPNLSGSNIQDTYQRVLHTDGTLVYNGTGSVMSTLPVTASHAISASIEVLKEVSSSYAETASFATEFTASVISASSRIHSPSYLIGHDAFASQYNSTMHIANNAYKTQIYGSNLTLGQPVTASSDISASGDITAVTGSLQNINFREGAEIKDDNSGNITIQSEDGAKIVLTDIVEISDSNNAFEVNSSGNMTIGEITASGNISASGHIYGLTHYAAGVQPLPGKDNVSFGSLGTVSQDYTITVGHHSSPAPLTIHSSISASNHISGSLKTLLQVATASIDGDITASGDISASGDIYSSRYILEGIPAVGYTGNELRLGVNANWVTTRIGNSGGSTIITSPLTASSHISTSGEIYGTDFYSYNKNFVNYHAGDDIFRVSADGTPVKFFTSIEATGAITASGNISTSGILIASHSNLPETTGQYQIAGFKGVWVQGGDFVFGNPSFDTKVKGTSIIHQAPLTASYIISSSVGAIFGMGVTGSGIQFRDTTYNQEVFYIDAMGSNGLDIKGGYIDIQGTNVEFKNNSDATQITMWMDADKGGEITASVVSASSLEGATVYADRFYIKDGAGGTGRFVYDGTYIHGNAHLKIDGHVTTSLASTVYAGTGSFPQLIGDSSLPTGLEVDGSITSSGDISASGNIRSATYGVAGVEVRHYGSIRSDEGIETHGDITSSAAITCSGTVIVNKLSVDNLSPLYESNGNLHFGQAPGLNINVGEITSSGHISTSLSSTVSAGTGSFVSSSVTYAQSTTGYNIPVTSDFQGLRFNEAPVVTYNLADTMTVGYSSWDLDLIGQDIFLNADAGVTASTDISASGMIHGQAGLTKHSFDGMGTGGGDHSGGDVVYFGTTTGMTAGNVYYYHTDGTWQPVNSDAVGATKLLAVALGTTNEHGLLLRGMVTLGAHGGSLDEGKQMYLSGTDGLLSADRPTTSGHYVRVVGYCMTGSNRKIWFCPDNTWVEIA